MVVVVVVAVAVAGCAMPPGSAETRTGALLFVASGHFAIFLQLDHTLQFISHVPAAARYRPLHLNLVRQGSVRTEILLRLALQQLGARRVVSRYEQDAFVQVPDERVHQREMGVQGGRWLYPRSTLTVIDK